MASLRQDFHDAIETFRQGNYPQAQEILTRLALENTENAQIRLWLGAACREAGCLEDAITNFQEVIRLSQDPRVVKIARTSLAKLEELMAQQDGQLVDDPPQEQIKSLQVTEQASTGAIVVQEEPHPALPQPNRRLRRNAIAGTVTLVGAASLALTGITYALTHPRLTQQVLSVKVETFSDIHALEEQPAFVKLRRLLLLGLLIGAGASAVIAGMIVALATRRNSRFITQAIEAAQRLTEGDHSTRMQVNRDDELGFLGNQLNAVAQKLQTLQDHQQNQYLQNQHQSAQYQQQWQQHQSVVAQIQALVQSLTSTVQEGKVLAASLIDETKLQEQSIHTALYQEQRLTEWLQALSTHSQQIEQHVQHTQQFAYAGESTIDRMIEGMVALQETAVEKGVQLQHLEESTEEITKVITLINRCANDTYLLALNTALALVRADTPEVRDFRTVAEGIQALSRQVTTAKADIEGLIDEMNDRVKQMSLALEAETVQINLERKLAETSRQQLQELGTENLKLCHLISEIAQSTADPYQTSVSTAESLQNILQTAQYVSNLSAQTQNYLDQLSANMESISTESVPRESVPKESVPEANT
jgi:methyl-accepting chemotaxis protein